MAISWFGGSIASKSISLACSWSYLSLHFSMWVLQALHCMWLPGLSSSLLTLTLLPRLKYQLWTSPITLTPHLCNAQELRKQYLNVWLLGPWCGGNWKAPEISPPPKAKSLSDCLLPSPFFPKASPKPEFLFLRVYHRN